MGQAFGLEKGVDFVLKPASPIEPSRGTNQKPNAGKPEASATETNPFSRSEKRLFHPQSIGGRRNVKTREKKGDPICPVEAIRLPDDQHVTTSLPGPDKEEGDVTPNDTNIPDSIARALLNALQEKRTGNQRPAMRISDARVGIVWPWEGTIRFDKPHCQNSTVSHTLEGISNQPSTVVPAKKNSSKSGLIPTTEQ